MNTLYLTEREGRHTGSREYVVTKAINTTCFSIGEIVTVSAAAEYCSSPNWKIIITKESIRP